MLFFDERKPFFKGNLHCHSTRSDGRLAPEEVARFYRELGYDFLALTDHRRLSGQARMEDGMLLLPGIEMDFTLPGEAVHIVGVGMRADYADDLSRGPQHCVDTMRAFGGRAILCHPAWSLNSVRTIRSLRGLTAVEVYNSMSTYPWNGDRADSSLLLDIAATQGTLLNLVASDDSHSYNGEAGRSCTMVQADDLSQQSLLDAMDAGRFYCTQGPRFQQIALESRELVVRCSPVKHVIFYSNLVWADGRCVTGDGLTEARYRLGGQPGETFVRVQLIDADGNSAWCSPMSLA